MKTIALIALWPLFFGFISDEPDPAIIGDWLLQETYVYGCFSTEKTSFRPNGQQVMTFSPPDCYKITVNDSLITSGSFKTRAVNNGQLGENGLILLLTSDASLPANLMYSPPECTISQLTSSRLVMSFSLGTFRGGSVYTRMQ
jgi:hypothetical protein